ncbi:enolase C-terminal domain-like protein [Actinokineospora sp. HUAS TT18]|uniref:enolase C-terminal domain-like protein n=1 Tax=Actinokineospora sp. HUAS TT18 TaxID=3447451 RepID=UPI003F51BFAC
MSHTTIELFRASVSTRTTWWFVRVGTPHGVGIGECSDAGPTAALIHDLHEVAAVIGERDVLGAREDIVSDLVTRARGLHGGYAHVAATALGGVEQALVDIAARADDVPVWKWLGGTARPTVPLYANINRLVGGRTPDDVADAAADAVAAGFRSVKCAPFDVPAPGLPLAEAGLRRLRAARAAVGTDVDLLADFHEHLSWTEVAALLPSLEELALGWIEDVVPLGALDRLAELRRRTGVPIAGGELALDVGDVAPAVAAGLVDVLMPDVKHVGGVRRAMAMAAAFPDVHIAPHNPSGPVSTVVSAHLLAAIPNGTVLEYAFGETPWRAELVGGAERLDAGNLVLGEEPGFGIDLDTTHPALSLVTTITL